MQPPNYRAAVQRIRSIKAKREKIAGVNGEIADIYAKIEGFKVNKKAAKIFDVLDRLDLVDRNDVLRSFQGLVDASGWEADAEDLVSSADGNVVPMRFNKTAAEVAEGDSVGDGEDDELDRELDAIGEDESGNADTALEQADTSADIDSILSRSERAEAADEITGVEGERPDDAHPGEATDGFQEATDEELARQAGRGKSRKAKADKPDAAPFTGDNSDLAAPQGKA
ncbi:MAG: hypothetical protein ABW128_06895 [Rhizorhabdus sp.]